MNINREVILVLSITVFLWTAIAAMVVVIPVVWKQQGRIIKLEMQMAKHQTYINLYKSDLEPIGPKVTKRGR